MLKVAIEGPSCAGKSTLLKNLSPLLAHLSYRILPDYVDAAGGDDVIPEAPADTIERDNTALEFYFNVDRMRWNNDLDHDVELVLMDRSPHTLLAHEAFMEHYLKRPGLLSDRHIQSQKASLNWPDLVFYLNVSQSELERRFALRGGSSGSIFVSEDYNLKFNGYFSGAHFATVNSVLLNGEASPDDIARQVRDILSRTTTQ